MLLEACNIEWISPAELDELLSFGWFRGRGIMFRAGIICFNGELQSTLNMRINVNAFTPKKSHRKLLRRNREKFRIQWGAPKWDEEHNLIFKHHSLRFSERTNESLSDSYLLEGPERQFDEFECSVFYEDRLIAFSYVDIGAQSMASIMCSFDSEFDGDSLGIYTMLEELEFAKKMGLQWYYPGYVLDHCRSFDYKLSLAPVEWLMPDQTWQSGERSILTQTPLRVLHNKMQRLHEMLSLHGIEATYWNYPYFSSGYMNTPDQMLRLPAYFSWRQSEKILAAGFDLDEGRFLFFEPIIAHEWDDYRHPMVQQEIASKPHFEKHYIKTEFSVYFDSFSSLYGIIEEILS
jgi:arginine-tRNA-protein transferase